MSPIQQMLLGVGAVATKTYVDDVFSTFLYKGTNSQRTLNVGIDFATEGGATFIKNRTDSDAGDSRWCVFDTVRGNGNLLHTNNSDAQANSTARQNNFSTTGFTVGAENETNGNNDKITSFNFRKAPGFFDVVTFNETGAPHSDFTVSHSLGCIPGMIILKRTDGSSDWWVWHKYDPTGLLRLNQTNANTDMTNDWCIPTSTNFTFRPTYVGAMGAASWVAYLFAGGESTAATARSVEFDNQDDYLALDSSSDLAFGTGDFTVEFWVYLRTGGYTALFDMRPTPQATEGLYPDIYFDGSNQIHYFVDATQKISANIDIVGQWNHIAVSRSGTSTKLFINGTQGGSTYSDSNNYLNGDTTIGTNANRNNSGNIDGYISNFRVLKGTALYTSSFRPPTEPLTNITNTKLLCCNNSSTTGSTVTPGTITANGDPTASTDSPFDDPAAFTFGDAGDQNVIKCGSYVGNGSSTGPEINLGWEPQWVLIKNTETTVNWRMFDSMRGISDISSGGDADDAILAPSSSNNEASFGANAMALTPRGFKLQNGGDAYNESGKNFIYIAVRRPDGYCGKPYGAGEGTSVFAMDTGAGGSTIPQYDSGFPVDFALMKKPASAQNWFASARLIQGKEIKVNGSDAQSAAFHTVFDSNDGWSTNAPTSKQSWMWKRHAGFDVVTYVGNQTSGHHIAHSCGQTPEMIWTKNRDQTQSWHVGHKDLNGGTNPWDYQLVLSDSPNEQENVNTGFWEAPTATHFTVGSDARVNRNNDDYLAILFSSVNGISKVGSYTGSSSALTITTGFQPRFIIIKNASSNSYDSSTDWFVFDTTRGWASGNNDKLLRLNEDDAQTTEDWTDPTSTGFTINADSGNDLNNNGDRYIYYAHA